MSRTGTIALAAGLALPLAGCASLAPTPRMVPLEPADPPPACPVTGKPVNFLVRATGPDRVVYFCCPECIAVFEHDPAAYADMAEMQRQMLALRSRVQVTCPITGDPVSPQRYTDAYGQRVYFCGTCGACPQMYEEDPDRYQVALEAAYTYQTRCPVDGRPIAPGHFLALALGGPRVYFCCPRCRRAYERDPQRYRKNLLAQGCDPRGLE
jgi:YHS domain-containing protein